MSIPVPTAPLWLAVDANILVGELLPERGRALFEHPRLRILIAQYTWGEAQTYLPRRVRDMHRVDEARGNALLTAALTTATITTRLVPLRFYVRHVASPRGRLKRSYGTSRRGDPNEEKWEDDRTDATTT